MGLDMYLSKKLYIGANYEHRKVTGEINMYIDEKPIKLSIKDIEDIVVRKAYRRKANQIHAWFVKNVQDDQDDCKEYEVSVEQLQALVKACETVLQSLEGQPLIKKIVVDKFSKKEIEIECYEHIDIAMELLPPQEGFFFGGYEIDEWYVENLKETIEQLKGLDEEYNNSIGIWTTYIYSSSR